MINEPFKTKIVAFLKPYNPLKISIFGSYARGEAKQGSDLDILISFKDNISLLKLVMIQQDLSEKLKIAVDLVSEKSLKNQRLIKSIQTDLITIFDEEERFNIS